MTPKLCRYCELKKVRTFATRNKRGFDLCQECYDSQAKAERESDEFNEQFYKNQAILMKENARFEDMIADKRRIQLMKEAMEAQDIVDRYIKESLLDIQLLEGIAKAMFDRNEQHSVDTYNWKGYTARLWNNQFPDVTDYWVMLAQTALKEFYEKTNAY